MKKLIEKILQERRITLFVTFLIACASIYAYTALPRQESPDVTPPVAMVIATYPGASPRDMNDLVTKKIEEKLATLPRYHYGQSTSLESVSVAAVFFENQAEPDKAMQDVRNAMADVARELPDGVQLDVRTELGETAGILISLSGGAYTYEQLASFGNQFKEALEELPGISRFAVKGELKKQIQVTVDIQKLNQLNLSLEELVRHLQSQNLEIPSGYLELSGRKVQLRAPGAFQSVQEIKDLMIAGSKETGVFTRLSDVADVQIGIEENAEKFKQNGENAVLLTGYFQQDKNVVTIGKEVRARIEAVKATLPSDLKVQEVVFQPESVKASTAVFMRNLVEGMLLVILVVFLGMGMRNAVVVSTAIPLSILMTFGMMYATGIKIHQMSLTALIIALGALVDDAIVISDMTQVRIDQGMTPVNAAIRGTQSAAVPIFSATLTTIVAFSPLLVLPGAAGEFIHSLPLVIIIAIVASYLTAMFVTPSIAIYTFKPTPDGHQEKRARLRQWFQRTLTYCLKHRGATMVGTFCLLAVILVAFLPQLPATFFPDSDTPMLYVDLTSEHPGNLAETEKLADQACEHIKAFSEIISVTEAIGDGLPKFYITMKPASPAANYAQLVCKFDLNTESKRFKTADALAKALQVHLDSHLAGGNASVKTLQYAEPAEAKVIVRVSGADDERIMDVVTQLKAKMQQTPGYMNVRDDSVPRTYQLALQVDSDLAGGLGMTNYDIQRQVNLALYGTTATVFRKDGQAYDIFVKSDIKGIDALESFGVKSTLTGQKLAIKQFAKTGYETKQDRIHNYNRAQTVHVYADAAYGFSASALESQIEDSLLADIDQTGVRISYDGEREQIIKYFGTAGILGLVVLFLIYLILLIQFKSFMDPLIILLTVPLSLIGSVTGLFLLRQPLSFTAILGEIALIGLVVKNGILLIEYVQQARKEGMDISEACVDAVGKRFNAIVLSSMTTVLGLFPLAISGSDLFSPMAITLMSGLLISSFLTLIIIPVQYDLFHRWLENRGSKSTQPPAADAEAL